MPSYSAHAAKGLTGTTFGAIGASIRKAAGSAKKTIQREFANAVRPREGFIRPSSVDLEQDLRELADTIANLRVEIITGETEGRSGQAETVKTARFQSSFGGFDIF